MRSIMTTERMQGVALMHVHKDTQLEAERIIRRKKQAHSSQFLALGYLLQTTQSWAKPNAGVTEDGHCQGACRPQWFFFVQN